MMFATCSLAFIGDKPLVSQSYTVDGVGYWDAFWVLVLQSFHLQHMSMHLMLAEATHTRYSPFDNRLLLVNLLAILLIWIFSSYLNILVAVKCLTGFTLFCLMTYIVTITNELATALSIRVFLVKPEKKESLLM